MLLRLRRERTKQHGGIRVSAAMIPRLCYVPCGVPYDSDVLALSEQACVYRPTRYHVSCIMYHAAAVKTITIINTSYTTYMVQTNTPCTASTSEVDCYHTGYHVQPVPQKLTAITLGKKALLTRVSYSRMIPGLHTVGTRHVSRICASENSY